MAPPQPKDDNAKWTFELTQIYVNLMVAEVRKGNRTTQTFSRQAWQTIRDDFEKQTGYKYNHDQFRNKFAKLKQDYASFKKLLETTGFGWNTMTRECTVDDDSIWDRHIKENHSWQKFRRSGCQYWPELLVIFGDTYATGEGAMSHRTAAHVENSCNFDDVPLHTPVGLSDEEGITSLEDTHDPLATTNPTHNHDRTPNAKRRRRSSKSSEFTCAFQVLETMNKSRMERQASISATSTPEGQYGVPKALDLLESIADEIPDATLNKAMDRIIQDENWRMTFVHLGPTMRARLLNNL